MYCIGIVIIQVAAIIVDILGSWNLGRFGWSRCANATIVPCHYASAPLFSQESGSHSVFLFFALFPNQLAHTRVVDSKQEAIPEPRWCFGSMVWPQFGFIVNWADPRSSLSLESTLDEKSKWLVSSGSGLKVQGS